MIKTITMLRIVSKEDLRIETSIINLKNRILKNLEGQITDKEILDLQIMNETDAESALITSSTMTTMQTIRSMIITHLVILAIYIERIRRIAVE